MKEYIPDKNLFSAVNFAVKMISEDGRDLAKAAEIASNYYKTNPDHVKYYVTGELDMPREGSAPAKPETLKEHMVNTDPKTLEAARYACELMRGGMAPGLAFYKASHAYNVDTKTLNRYVSSFGGKRSHKHEK